MSWDAATEWDIVFREGEDGMKAARVALAEGVVMDAATGDAMPPGTEPVRGESYRRSVLFEDVDGLVVEGAGAAFLSGFGSEVSGELGEDGRSLYGSTWGACWTEKWAMQVLARFADGTVDVFEDSDRTMWRYRLRGGEVTVHDGQVVYPTDPGCAKS